MPGKLDFHRSSKTMMIFERMLNELIGIINPDDKSFSEQIATLVYKCLMKVYTEASAILGADIVKE